VETGRRLRLCHAATAGRDDARVNGGIARFRVEVSEYQRPTPGSHDAALFAA